MSWADPRAEDIFPTRLLRARLADDELAAEVAAQAIERSRRVPTVTRGELTGWQSGDDLASWSPACAKLVDLLAHAIMDATRVSSVKCAAWANVLRDGDYFTPHTHSNAAWSGAVYVDIGDSSLERGGVLCLRDPRGGVATVIAPSNAAESACTLRIVPRQSELIAFPAWLVHWVSPYRGVRPRVSVAFNAL